ncbi:MAG: type II pantothenate kinase [Clostridia bacterium]
MLVLGIDIGGSTTKIVAFDEEKQLIASLQVTAADQLTCLYGAIGNLLYQNNLDIKNVKEIVLTGVGATKATGDIYGIPTMRIKEIEAIGHGALMLSGLKKALVVSMGTGTAFVEAEGDKTTHIGGSGVGGGTIMGLSSKLVSESKIDPIVELAQDGDLSKVDLMIKDISNEEIPLLPDYATASNFGKISNTAKRKDLSLGLMNMVYQTVGMMAVFACRNTDIKKIVVTGSVAKLPNAKILLDEVGSMYNLEFIIPERAVFATAIGAVMLYFAKTS